MKTLSNNEIEIILIAISMLLVSSFIIGKLFEAIKAPKVIGEITGGMVLGPSLLGIVAPNIYNNIFCGFMEEQKILDIFYQLGLMMLMFTSGYNTNISINRQNIKKYSMLFIGATIIPTILGIPFINTYNKVFIGNANNYEAYAIIFLISMSITSIPVISKIFFDIDMMNTKYANMVLNVATVQDICLWVMLNIAISIVNDRKPNTIKLLTITFLTLGALIGIKLLENFIRNIQFKISKDIINIGIITLLNIVIILNTIGINIMYSSFIAGYLVKAVVGDNNTNILKIKEFAFAFFIPIYFSLVGIKIDIIHNFNVARFLVFFLIAFGIEFIGVVIVMIKSGLSKKAVVSLGITMNARGGPGIVLATTAYANEIINVEFFTILIITTMISSALAGYWLRLFKEDIKNEG